MGSADHKTWLGYLIMTCKILQLFNVLLLLSHSYAARDSGRLLIGRPALGIPIVMSHHQRASCPELPEVKRLRG